MTNDLKNILDNKQEHFFNNRAMRMKVSCRTNEIKEKQFFSEVLSFYEKVESKEYKTSSLVYSRDVYVEHVHGED